MTIKAAQVKELREATGVGMMECKKAACTHLSAGGYYVWSIYGTTYGPYMVCELFFSGERLTLHSLTHTDGTLPYVYR